MHTGSPDFESGQATQVRFLPGEQSSQVSGLSALVERLGSGQHFTLSCTHSADDEVPLPEPEGKREWVHREGWGWVERPVEVPEIPAEQVAAA